VSSNARESQVDIVFELRINLIKVRYPKIVVALVFVGVTVALCLMLVFSQRTRKASQQVRPRRAGSGSNQITLKVGGNLQEAIKSAQFGDTIVLDAGATYKGPLILPYKAGGTSTDADYITIRTSNLAGIARDGERIRPEFHAASMPKIVSPGQGVAIGTAQQAHHYKFVGIEFSPASNADYVYNLIDLGGANYSSYSQYPHHIIFDRCYIHSTGMNKARRGFALNSSETSIINSHVSGFAGDGDETQAIAGWNGPGPFHIINNYLEGGAEVLLFGGADPSISGVVPSDIEIRRNFFHKPAEWAGRATIKGTFELKNAKRVVVDGNVIDTGIRVTAFVLTVRNQNGKAPWSTIEDVQITNNIVRHASTGLNILGKDDRYPSQEARRITIANNLFLDLVTPGDINFFLQTSGADSVTVVHNTVQQAGNIISSYGDATRNFAFIDNIVQYNSYGIACFIEGPTCPDVPFCHCFPGGTVKGNVIADNANVSANYPIQRRFPPGNFFTSSYQEIGFVDHAGGNWQLAPNSTYRKKASDRKDPGVDFTLLNSSGVNLATDGSASK